MTKALSRFYRKLTVENLWIYVIKGIQEVGKPLTGYEVKVVLRERFGVNPPAITVYTVLYRMVREGLLKRVSDNGVTKYVVDKKGLESFKQAVLFLEKLLLKLKTGLEGA